MLWPRNVFPGTNLQDLNLDWILKKFKALRGGRTGQYLYKKSDADFDFGWKTGGGGGGATDYLDLDNKPRINNIELAGNKTAADLGLALSADIPQVPVQSVNGQTGAVVLDAVDVGAYVKPETGIPKTDLSSPVQGSLDKADTALQAVPVTYRTAAAQDTIDAAQNAKIETLAGSLATIETSPATAAHAIGDYIVYNGQLYRVNSAIAAGLTLTIGTNITVVSGGGFNDLRNNLFVTRDVTSEALTIAANDAGEFAIAIPQIAQYEPFSIAQMYIAGVGSNGAAFNRGFQLQSTRVLLGVRNTTTASRTWTCACTVVYKHI